MVVVVDLVAVKVLLFNGGGGSSSSLIYVTEFKHDGIELPNQ